MAVTHKRKYRARTGSRWEWVTCGLLCTERTSWLWAHVTCKNCLKHRPKGKR